MGEWIRFAVVAVLLVTGLGFLTAGVLGNCRFRYVMNRVHAAGVGDTMGLFFVVLALAAGAGAFFPGARLFLPLIFLWITSPVSSHFLSQIEYYTGADVLYRLRRKQEGPWN